LNVVENEGPPSLAPFVDKLPALVIAHWEGVEEQSVA
jgi:hypothetical protein